MDLAAFFETLRDPSGNAVPYIQKQCNSLDEEFGQLRDDIAELEIGKTVFEHLDATNLWIGDERAVSATHSDPYENLYCVVAGTKHVTLYPPTDLPFLYRKTFSVGQYVREPSGSFNIIQRPGTVPWISVDPSDRRQFPLYEYASPLEVEVQAGDVLYLPALWYHRVAQSADLEGRTIAVNFWSLWQPSAHQQRLTVFVSSCRYDMQFDSRYTWMRFQESLVVNGC